MDTSDTRTDFFDRRAATWEALCYPPETRARIGPLVDDLGIRPGERILDMGTGTGILLPDLLRATGPGGRVFAFDLSRPMVREAKRKPEAARAGLFQADALRLPLRDAAMDRIVCFACFPHLPDPEAALAEMARALVPGGRLAIAHLMSREELSRHHGGCADVAEDRLPPAERMTELFRNAGFAPPRIADRPGRYLALAFRNGGGRR